MLYCGIEKIYIATAESQLADENVYKEVADPSPLITMVIDNIKHKGDLSNENILSIYRKIPIISPGLILFQRPFLPENNR